MKHGCKKACWFVAVLDGERLQQDRPRYLGNDRTQAGRSIVSCPTISSKRGHSFSGRLVLENRVKTRLHWDRALAEASIEVHATDKAVELKGTLSSQEQVRRAVELAESTVGVDRVVNSLQVERP